MPTGLIFTRGPNVLPPISGSVDDLFANPDSGIPIYTLIKQIVLTNITGTPVVVWIYLGVSGGDSGGTEIIRAVIPPFTTVPFYFSNLRMGDNDVITGACDTENAVNYIINMEIFPLIG